MYNVYGLDFMDWNDADAVKDYLDYIVFFRDRPVKSEENDMEDKNVLPF